MSAEINWFELPAADTARAREFYGKLFGWHTAEYGGDYHVIDNGPAGAIAPKDAQFTHPRVYFHTADIDAAVTQVRDLGGTSENVVPVPGVGRIAHCRDDQASAFSLFEPTE